MPVRGAGTALAPGRDAGGDKDLERTGASVPPYADEEREAPSDKAPGSLGAALGSTLVRHRLVPSNPTRPGDSAPFSPPRATPG